jgi:hypothetical protein
MEDILAQPDMSAGRTALRAAMLEFYQSATTRVTTPPKEASLAARREWLAKAAAAQGVIATARDSFLADLR